jgi:hypothetical protein
MSDTRVLELEVQLDALDAPARQEALHGLMALAESGVLPLPALGKTFNLHAHSFFSFNGYGYSPTGLAWRARRAGLYALGLVDFDVLDGVPEFLAACDALGLRACAGMETRVFVPEFGDRVINSPGEPGVSYHMGVGFTAASTDGDLTSRLRQVAGERTRGLVTRVNTLLHEIALDFDADVAALTPAGNATERHVCAAYDTKARAVFADPAACAAYWSGKLGVPQEKALALLDDAPALQALIRSKTMKAGGVGYVQPEGPDFPRVEEVNAFSRACGAIPTFAWLDGTSAAELVIDELLDVMTASGVAAVNIIPDRNWNFADPDVRKDRVARLYDFVRKSEARRLPVLIGTEMNAHGQRFVDDFEAPELQPLYGIFRAGADLVHAHTLLQRHAGMGYLSPWAEAHFHNPARKNDFYEAIGSHLFRITPRLAPVIHPELTPEQIAGALGFSFSGSSC